MPELIPYEDLLPPNDPINSLLAFPGFPIKGWQRDDIDVDRIQRTTHVVHQDHIAITHETLAAQKTSYAYSAESTSAPRVEVLWSSQNLSEASIVIGDIALRDYTASTAAIPVTKKVSIVGGYETATRIFSPNGSHMAFSSDQSTQTYARIILGILHDEGPSLAHRIEDVLRNPTKYVDLSDTQHTPA